LRARRHRRGRAHIFGTAKKPRLAVFRSNRFLYVQLIDDERGATLASASSQDVQGKSMVKAAEIVGASIAKHAIGKGITSVVFDRGGFTYTGRIKVLADSARKGGLIF